MIVRTAARVRVALMALCCASFACGSGSKPSAVTGGHCVMNSDCNEPLLCTASRCHAQCVKTRDCPTGQRCVQTASGSECLLPVEDKCTYNSNCDPPLICAVDAKCRNQCQTDRDCRSGQTCTPTTKVCADPEELGAGSDLPHLNQNAVDAGPTAGVDGGPRDGSVGDGPVTNAAPDGPLALDGGAGNDGSTGSDGPADTAATVTPDAAPPGTTTYLYVGGGGTLSIMSFDPASGALAYRSSAAIGTSAAWGMADAQGKHAYVDTVGPTHSIFSFDIQPADGTLTRTGALPLSTVLPAWQMRIAPTGAWLVTSGKAGGVETDFVAAIGSDGKLGMLHDLIPGGAVGWFAFDPSGKYLYGGDFRRGQEVYQFKFDPASGKAAPNTPNTSAVSPAHQVDGITFHANNKWAYTFTNYGEIGFFTFDSATGNLLEQAYTPNPVPADPVVGYEDVAIHPNGTFLYGIGWPPSGQMTVDIFSINASSGSLTFLKRDMGDAAHQLVLSEAQTQSAFAHVVVGDLMVLGGTANAKRMLATYRIGAGDGMLTPVGNLIDTQSAEKIDFMFTAKPQP